MSPILVRPVREQLEHDRIIRLLHGKSRRKYDAGMNPGAEQNAPVGSGTTVVFPDLVLHSAERSRRLEVIVEVETGLPIGMRSFKCPYASATGMAGMNLGHVVLDFYDRNCVGREKRLPVRFPNLSH